MALAPIINDDRLIRLAGQLPSDILFSDEFSRTLYAQDVLTKAAPALAVVRPRDTAELSAALKSITALGLTVIPRGGGMSYTSGYVPRHEGSVIIDLSSMDKIIDINTIDMTVTVEAGCTWAKLHEALKPRGLRTPFWGSLSGKFATIGGGASQNAVFWGCGTHGSAVDSILAMEVVLADGSILKTAPGFFRPYGPDMTGLFCADTGALGFKATITLKLIHEAKALRYASFSFADYNSQIAAMSEIARQQLASECFGFDPFLQAQRMKRESMAKDAKALLNMMKAQGSLLGALKEGAKVALAGRNFLYDVPYSLHIIVEGKSDGEADANMEQAKQICKINAAQEIDNSIPKILRANPFGPVNSMVGPQGERWAPVHGILPHSKAAECVTRIEEIFANHQALIDLHNIGTGYLFATVGVSGFVVEPVFFWPDELTEIHKHYVEKDHLDKISGFPSNPESRAVVLDLRAQLVDLFHTMGAAHLQIGKAYRYRDSLGDAGKRIMGAVKNAVDPNGRINPGSIGLGD
jgi:FAD/FMN-containing dehydrogenase